MQYVGFIGFSSATMFMLQIQTVCIYICVCFALYLPAQLSQHDLKTEDSGCEFKNVAQSDGSLCCWGTTQVSSLLKACADESFRVPLLLFFFPTDAAQKQQQFYQRWSSYTFKLDHIYISNLGNYSLEGFAADCNTLTYESRDNQQNEPGRLLLKAWMIEPHL